MTQDRTHMSPTEMLSALDTAKQLIVDLNRELQSAHQRAEAAERERDLAIAHDRQPYPTAWAYEQVCKARNEWESRALAAEARLAAVEKDKQ